jgi:GTP-binding protein
LIHVLDGLSPDPLGDFSQINAEMALFDENLGHKPQIVVLNKVDMPEAAEQWKIIEKKLEKQGYETMAISALIHQNLQPLLWKVVALLKRTPEIEEKKALPVYRSREDPGMFQINRVSDGWQVRGAGIERAAAMTYWEFEGSVRRFQRLMNRLGIEDALRDAGIKDGDTVYIGQDYELEWTD